MGAAEAERRSKPIVSVVVPAFNRLMFLRPAIQSVFAQTFTDWQLIVADDGSDLETQRFLLSLADDPRVVVIRLPHSGRPSKVRNAGVSRATGDYVAFLDSDDLWLAHKLERQLEILHARAKCRWSYTAFLQVDESGKPLPEEALRPWNAHEGDIFEQVVTGRAQIRTPTVLAARELIAQAGGFDEGLISGEDFDLWLRLALCSDVAIVDEPLVHVRRHPNSHTSDWQSAFVGRDSFLSQRQQLVEGPRRALMRRERMRNALTLAATHAELGDQGPMFRALWQSLAYSWTYPRWWLGCLKTVLLRPYLSRRRAG
jgi:glycosyltransferase involved in cell wall biosynthesis